VAEVTGLPIKIEPGLSEWLNRKWFPTPPEIVVPGELRIHPARIDPSYRSLGAARHGESGLEALRRSGATTLRLVEELTGNLLLVGHRASMLGATLALLGISQAKLLRLHPVFDDIPPAFLVALDRTRTGWTLRLEP
jgi:broad specificity phosphatase PhoE